MDISENECSSIGMETRVVSCGGRIKGRRPVSSSGTAWAVKYVLGREPSLTTIIPQPGRGKNSSVMRCGMCVGLVDRSIVMQSALFSSVLCDLCHHAVMHISVRLGEKVRLLRIVLYSDVRGADEWL